MYFVQVLPGTQAPPLWPTGPHSARRADNFGSVPSLPTFQYLWNRYATGTVLRPKGGRLMAGDQPSEAQALRAIERLVADSLLPRVVVAVRSTMTTRRAAGRTANVR